MADSAQSLSITRSAIHETPSRWARLCQTILEEADIRINGNRAWDIRVHHPLFYRRVLGRGSVGLGESYMDGWWDCDRLDEFFHRVCQAGLPDKVPGGLKARIFEWSSQLINCQSPRRAYEVGRKHYDIGNNLYQAMLDSRMIYSCGYWKEAQSLDEAQANKLELVCRKLHLKNGLSVLDIGCGWGGLAKYAAQKYGVAVVGITVSKEQACSAKADCRGLPVEIRLQDYRELDQRFDRVVSIGMFEHVGYKNYRSYMKIVRRSLKDGGLFLLHTIGTNRSCKSNDEWIHKYIFPNSQLPSARQISESIEGLFVMEDWHNFGADYDKTLMAWHGNFSARWDGIKSKYNARFYRMWTYYLLACAGAFRARKNQLWQIVLSKGGLPSGYRSPR